MLYTKPEILLTTKRHNLFTQKIAYCHNQLQNYLGHLGIAALKVRLTVASPILRRDGSNFLNGCASLM